MSRLRGQLHPPAAAVDSASS